MMEAEAQSCVPPGFRFHPTDEELVGYYLRKKVASQKIDLDVITDIDLYRIEPWDLQEKCRIGYEEQNEWYFFSHKDKKYPTGTRTNRATMAGFWKATGRDKAVYDNSKLIGMRKTLVFYKGRAPNGHKSDWIMHEYRLESQQNAPPQEEGWVVCRAFKKRSTGQSRSTADAQRWDSAFYYDSKTVDVTRPPCKQERADQSLQFMQSDKFIQLPQLQSPSLTLTKRACTTDWRDLDKFVASQLSQEVNNNNNGLHDSDSDVGLLLLQTTKDGEFNHISTSDPDIGICIFNK